MQVNISGKVKEAETYRSMGLLEESIFVYEEILSSENTIEEAARNRFESTVTSIREELEDLENDDENAVTAEEIAIIKDTLSLTDEVPHLVESASAFMELGQYKHALSKYEKLLTENYAWKDILKDIATCLIKCCGLSEILPRVQEMVAKNEIDGKDKAEIQFRIGLEMQKRDLRILAQELCCSAKESDPESEKIKKWLNSNGLRQHFIAKQDPLIIHNREASQQTELEESNFQQGDLAESNTIFKISIAFAEEEQTETESTTESSTQVVRLVDQTILPGFPQKVSDPLERKNKHNVDILADLFKESAGDSASGLEELSELTYRKRPSSAIKAKFENRQGFPQKNKRKTQLKGKLSYSISKNKVVDHYEAKVKIMLPTEIKYHVSMSRIVDYAIQSFLKELNSAIEE